MINYLYHMSARNTRVSVPVADARKALTSELIKSETFRSTMEPFKSSVKNQNKSTNFEKLSAWNIFTQVAQIVGLSLAAYWNCWEMIGLVNGSEMVEYRGPSNLEHIGEDSEQLMVEPLLVLC